jgi:hypothetical protein
LRRSPSSGNRGSTAALQPIGASGPGRTRPAIVVSRSTVIDDVVAELRRFA